MYLKTAFYLLLLSSLGFSQNNFISIEQLIDIDVAKRYGIKKVYAVENDTNCILNKNCQVSSWEEYDKAGRIIAKENNWYYADKPSDKRIFRYDSLDRIERQKYYQNDQLINIDYFTYDQQNRLVDWLVYFGNGEKSINKKITYEENRVANESLFANDTFYVKDSVYLELDKHGRVVKEVKIRGKQVDSLIFQYDKGDTILSEIRFINQKLYSLHQTIKVKNTTMLRRVIVEDGRMMGVDKKFYAENGNLTEHSLVHHFAESNFKKKYFYNKKGILQRKEIYRNSNDPEVVIYYLLKYFSYE